MPSKKSYIKAYLSKEEQAQIAAQARRAGLSVSKFARAVCLGHEVKSVVDEQAIISLIQSKADLGRLGGLLKLHLASPGEGQGWHSELRNLLRQIEIGQREMLRDFRLVSASYTSGRKK